MDFCRKGSLGKSDLASARGRRLCLRPHNGMARILAPTFPAVYYEYYNSALAAADWAKEPPPWPLHFHFDEIWSGKTLRSGERKMCCSPGLILDG